METRIFEPASLQIRKLDLLYHCEYVQTKDSFDNLGSKDEKNPTGCTTKNVSKFGKAQLSFEDK